MQTKLLENVVDKVVVVYENCNTKEDKFRVGYFAIDPEAILDFAHSENEEERKNLEGTINAQKEKINAIDFGKDDTVPKLCGCAQRWDTDVGYLDGIDVPVIFAGYCVDQKEAEIGLEIIKMGFIINYRAMLKKGLLDGSAKAGGNGMVLEDYVAFGERGNLAKDLRQKCESMIGFQVSGQEHYKNEVAQSLRGLFSGTPYSDMANQMIDCVAKAGNLSSETEKANDEMAKQYVGLITASVFEDFSSAKDFKFKIGQLKDQVNNEAGKNYE